MSSGMGTRLMCNSVCEFQPTATLMDLFSFL